MECLAAVSQLCCASKKQTRQFQAKGMTLALSVIVTIKGNMDYVRALLYQYERVGGILPTYA